jgi:hypothetical protein
LRHPRCGRIALSGHRPMNSSASLPPGCAGERRKRNAPLVVMPGPDQS